MSFEKKKSYFKFLDTHLKNPEIQSYFDLLSNFSYPHKTIFKKSKTDSLYESLLFAYLEQQIILNNNSGLELIMKLVDSDTSEIYEWPHWNSNKKNIKIILSRLEEKMIKENNNPQETLNYLYSLKENNLDLELDQNNIGQQVLPFQNYLNILMRYVIMTHIIIKRDSYFANLDVLKKFFENTKIYSLQQGFSEVAVGFLPYIFTVNFKLFCWEKKDETNQNFSLKKKYYLTKDEKWKENPTICLIQNEDLRSYRFLPSKELEKMFYNRVIEDFCGNYNDLIKAIAKYYNDYVQVAVDNLKNEFDIFKKKKDPFELLFYENHDLEEINVVFKKLNNLTTIHKIKNPNFSCFFDDFVFQKTNQMEINFKELHSYIQKINQYNTYSYKFREASTKDSSSPFIFPENNKRNNIFTEKDNYDNPTQIIYNENDNKNNDNKFSDNKLMKQKEPKLLANPLQKEKNTGLQNFIEPFLIQNKQEDQMKKIIANKKLILNSKLTNNNIIEEQKFNGIVNNPPLKMKCPICSSEVSVDENIITLECEHKICKECLTGWLMAKYDLGQWDLDNFKCFMPECNQTINIHILKHIISEEKFTKMCDKVVENLCINCPYLDCKLFFMNELKNQQKILCPGCQRAICSKCNEKFHETKACPKLFNIALKALKNEKLNVCPECFEVYLKDDKCAHVKCMKCATEFCFECSSLRVPTMTHGNHYHRLDCKFYFEKEDPKTKKLKRDDEYDPKNCKLCKESGKACKRPISYKEFYNKFIKEKK